MDMNIKGLRKVNERKYRVTTRGIYGQIVSVPAGTNLAVGDEVQMYSTESGDFVVIQRVKKARR